MLHSIFYRWKDVSLYTDLYQALKGSHLGLERHHNWQVSVATGSCLCKSFPETQSTHKHARLEAHLPMGLWKYLHIKAITKMEDVQERWNGVYGKYPDQGDVDNMPMQLDCLHQYTDLLPGCAQALNTLKTDINMKVGSSTKFLKSMVNILLEEPFMIYRNLDLLSVHPIQYVVKADDTVSRVGKALGAGCWGVGVARYIATTWTLIVWRKKTLCQRSRHRRKQRSHVPFWGRVLLFIWLTKYLPEVCADINQQLAKGERPWVPCRTRLLPFLIVLWLGFH